MVQREAVFLISRATEEFVARIAEASQAVASREGRATVQAKDLSTCLSSDFTTSMVDKRVAVQSRAYDAGKSMCFLKVRVGIVLCARNVSTHLSRRSDTVLRA